MKPVLTLLWQGKYRLSVSKLSEDLYGESYFEGRGSNYWWTIGSYRNLRNYPHWEEILRNLHKFKLEGKFLDIGCAYGFLVEAASKRFEAFGIDISKFAIKKSTKYCRGKISRASGSYLPFKDESFDVVAIIDTLEHIQQLNRCLKDIVRILRKEGILFLQLPNPIIWSKFCGCLCANLGFEDETHVNNFSLNHWCEVLDDYGLKPEISCGIVAFASKRVRFLLRSEKVASLLPELWIIAKKQ
jgi:SAM-dependent methyltransferase